MIIFLHIPKTAGTSFRFVLENSFGARHCHAGHVRKKVFGPTDLEFAKAFFPRLQSIAGHNLVDPLQLPVSNPFYITFLREPISRVLSQYQDNVIRGHSQKSFEESLQERGVLENLHVKLMAGDRNLDKAKRYLERCHMVGLTEKFNLSLHVLDRLKPCPINLNYRRRVVARDNSVKDSVVKDSRLLDLAREYNQLDLALYDFAVKEIFPMLCQRAGIDPAEKVVSFENFTSTFNLRFTVGRLYNKLFRQACKLRR